MIVYIDIISIYMTNLSDKDHVFLIQSNWYLISPTALSWLNKLTWYALASYFNIPPSSAFFIV